ncbi:MULTISPECIES: hypothetical protein [Sphingobium]|uniref:Holin n=1 Tax=Sphingobium fuliginis (strain ATCC 27551) TaxID=336203 RepID=A0ABQ1EVP4_SPHSA|nr:MULTISPECIES: hypothetical protein [Sphingobium]RYL98679.1 hypothetical protein EWH10_09210 [Sphingobium fuliginis]WDA37485.1 hypothetical protein PO876_04615 [Sphingobium sp. YC-XJ3]GFZ89575.1 hypothetical protein GCM10019071_19410 [Sphingobium fuliginis]
MGKFSGGIEANAGKVAEAVERWKAGIASLALLVALGGAAFLVAAIPMTGAAALFDAAYLASTANIAGVAAVAVFPWLITNKNVSRALRLILGLDSRQ